MFHVLHDSLLTNGLLYPPLRLHIERVSIECFDRVLPFHFSRDGPFVELSEKLSKPSGRIDRFRQLGLNL